MRGDESDDGVGQNGCAEEVSEEACQTCCRTCCVLGHQIQGLYSHQHDRTIDEESDTCEAQRDETYAGSLQRGGIPVDADEDGHECHKDHSGPGTVPLEESVADDAADERTRYGCIFVSEVCPSSLLDIHSLVVK